MLLCFFHVDDTKNDQHDSICYIGKRGGRRMYAAFSTRMAMMTLKTVGHSSVDEASGRFSTTRVEETKALKAVSLGITRVV